MAENRAEFEINIYSPTTWNNLSDHEEFTKQREVGKTTVSVNFLSETRILKTVCKKYTETWQRPSKHPDLDPAGKEWKTNRDISRKSKKYHLFHCIKY